MTALTALTIAEFVEAVGQDRPAPGCGAAAAISLALAAACARKALVISARRGGGAPGPEAAAERCRVLAAAAVEAVQRDADNFRALLKAPPGENGPALTLEGDAQVLIAMAAELRELLGRHAQAIAPDLRGDAEAALAFTEAFERVQRTNLAQL